VNPNTVEQLLADRKIKAYLALHLSILIFGLTGPLGKWITLGAFLLVWYRVLFTTGLFLVGGISKAKKLSIKDALRLGGIGLLLILHWIGFYGSIKLSNVSIAMVCLSTTVLFITFLEPIFFKKRLQPLDMIISLVVVIGIALIYRFQHFYISGIIVGLVSAFLAALYSLFNKAVVRKYNNETINCYEFGIGGLMYTALLLIGIAFGGEYLTFELPENGSQWLLIFFLAFACTNLPYNLTITALRHVSVFNYVLAFNLETIYGLIIAYWFLEERKEMNLGMGIGVFLVLSAVILYPLLKHRLLNKARQQGQL
jgi:drug/metabolite transporter (DMT)-like permease